MSDFIFIGSGIVAPTGEAPSGFPENLVTTWVEDMEPSPGISDVGIATSIKIRFARSIDTSLTTLANFELHCPSGTEVSDPFIDINWAYDYNSISRSLWLKPNSTLNPLSKYTVVVKDLFDAGGSSMTEEHFWSFETGVGPSGELYEDHPEPDIDVVIIEDYAPQFPAVPGTVSSEITSVPFNGQIGVASGYASGAVTIDFGSVVDDTLISVKKESWASAGGIELVDVDISQTTGGVVTIQFPESPSGSGIYFETNVAYYIDAIYTIISFTGPIDPLYASPAVVTAMLGDNQDPIDAARMMYYTSLEIQTIISLMDTDVTYLWQTDVALQQLALYMSLYRVTSISTGEDFQLGQLRITDTSRLNSSNPYYSPLLYWKDKVFGGFSPKQVLTIDRESHDFLRGWNRNDRTLPYTYPGRSTNTWED